MDIIKTVDKWYTKQRITEITTLVGNRKYGKSYLAGKLEEIYEDKGWPWLCVDKMGIHYATRNKYDKVIIIGGDHGDYGLDEIDKYLPLILEQDLNCIVDVSEYDDLFAQEFVAELFEYLWMWHKEHKKPRNYIIEESDFFIGQTGSLKEVKDVIVKCITKGRMYGFGFTLISQRYRMIEKTALAQTDNYVIFNMKLPLDLNLLKQLIGEKLDMKIKRLKVGQAIIMTDEGHSTYSVGERKTPSASNTPEYGVPIKTVEIMPLNKEVSELLTELEGKID